MNDAADNQRRHPRYNLPVVKVLVEGREHDLLDVSTEGVFIGAVDGDWQSGDPIEFILRVPLLDKVSPLVVEGIVVRKADAGLAVQYATPNRTWPQVLRVLDMKTAD